MKNYKVEICANSAESCKIAQEGGADRVELCAAMPEGGTTPSAGEIMTARNLLTEGTKLHIMIRPRGGDFVYSPLEIESMIHDIDMAHDLLADGVVFGCLTNEGNIDDHLMTKLIRRARGMSVTFHRAFDMCRNPSEALIELIDLGVDRVLSSGQRATAEEGIPLLRRLQEQAAGRLTIMAGCGVNEENIAKIAAETGIREFHFSGRVHVPSSMKFKNEAVSMGNSSSNEYMKDQTSLEKVRNTIAALEKWEARQQ